MGVPLLCPRRHEGASLAEKYTTMTHLCGIIKGYGKAGEEKGHMDGRHSG